MKRSGVYQIRNLQNGKLYIGSTTRLFSARKSEHWRDLRQGRHCTQHLQRAWKKYGEQSFVFEVIEICAPELCETREQYYLDALQPQYNGSKFAANPRGYKWSDESKAKVSGENNHAYGKPKSDDVKTKISAAKIGIGRSEDSKKLQAITRKKLGLSKGTRNPSAKLTEVLVKEIREKRQHSQISYVKLALLYNVDRRTISRVCQRQIWSHV